MADVLIRGMEMPESCDECPSLTEDGDYNVCFVGKRRVMWEWKHDRGSEVIHPKPDWCPLIEITSHGRLIDADKLLRAAWENFDFVPRWMVKEAPTVIEASVGVET